MRLTIQWISSQPLTDGSGNGLFYATRLDKLPKECGIYIFGRRWGKKKFEALYVGRTTNIRGRVMKQLNDVRLMQHVKSAAAGKRVLMAGTFATRSDLKKKKCLPLLERAFIRYFVLEGHDLVNKQGTRIRRHEVQSTGAFPKSFFPNRIGLEIARSPRPRQARRHSERAGSETPRRRHAAH